MEINNNLEEGKFYKFNLLNSKQTYVAIAHLKLNSWICANQYGSCLVVDKRNFINCTEIDADDVYVIIAKCQKLRELTTALNNKYNENIGKKIMMDFIKKK